MNLKQIEQLVTPLLKIREYDWYDGKWTQDDESSLSSKEFQELVNPSDSTTLLLNGT